MRESFCKSLTTASVVRRTSSRGPVKDSRISRKSEAAVSVDLLAEASAVEVEAASTTASLASAAYLRMREKRVVTASSY